MTVRRLCAAACPGGAVCSKARRRLRRASFRLPASGGGGADFQHVGPGDGGSRAGSPPAGPARPGTARRSATPRPSAWSGGLLEFAGGGVVVGLLAGGFLAGAKGRPGEGAGAGEVPGQRPDPVPPVGSRVEEEVGAGGGHGGGQVPAQEASDAVNGAGKSPRAVLVLEGGGAGGQGSARFAHGGGVLHGGRCGVPVRLDGPNAASVYEVKGVP